MRTLSLLAVALVLAAPAVAAAEPIVLRYVAGLYRESGGLDVQGVCTGASDPTLGAHDAVAGGACDVPVQPGTVRVTVTDDVLGPFAFSWDAFTGSYPNVTCRLAGSGHGEAVIELPAGCTELDVYVSMLGTTGTITIASG